MDKSSLVYVIAGSYSEAIEWAKKEGIVNWVYIANVDQLRGRRIPEFLGVGRYKTRADFHELQMIIRANYGVIKEISNS